MARGSYVEDLLLNLPGGAYKADWIDPASGEVLERSPIKGVVLQKPLYWRTEPQSLGYRLFSFQSEDFPDELNLPKDIPFRQPPHLAFPDHMQNLVALNRPPGSIE